MKRWTVTVVAIGLMASAIPAYANSSQRAMWVWDSPSTEVLAFSVDKGVDRIFLHAAPGFSADPAFSSFLDNAHAAGIEVFALAGDPTWAAKNTGHFLNWVDEVVAYGEFDGLAPDIEPYALSEWRNKKRRSRVISSYLDALEDANARSGGLPLIPAVPFWWDNPDFAIRGNLLIDEVMSRVDGVAVMAYRDTADGVNGIIALADYEVSLGAASGKQVIIGVETAPDLTYEHITFYEEGEAAMEAELAKTDAYWAGASGHWGNAIHHYGSYTQLGD